MKIFNIFTDAPDCPACDEAIKQLEQIDDDTDAVGVKFVKTDDADFATEFGITEFPAILYFEDKEPSIYDGKDKSGEFFRSFSFYLCYSTLLHLPPSVADPDPESRIRDPVPFLTPGSGSGILKIYWVKTSTMTV